MEKNASNCQSQRDGLPAVEVKGVVLGLHSSNSSRTMFKHFLFSRSICEFLMPDSSDGPSVDKQLRAT